MYIYHFIVGCFTVNVGININISMGGLYLWLREFFKPLFFNMFIIMIVYDMALVLPDDIQRTQHVQCIIDSSLHILEVNSL